MMNTTNLLEINNEQAGINKKTYMLFVLFLLFTMLVMVKTTYAGAGGMEFEDVWITIKDWTQGTLGRVIAGSMILVGIIGGVARQSLMAFALGIGGGIGLYSSPNIVESIMSASLEYAAPLTGAMHHLGNGLVM